MKEYEAFGSISISSVTHSRKINPNQIVEEIPSSRRWKREYYVYGYYVNTKTLKLSNGEEVVVVDD